MDGCRLPAVDCRTCRGLNLTGGAKEWTTVIGSIAFLAGLGIVGAVWLKTRFHQQESKEKKAADQ